MVIGVDVMMQYPKSGGPPFRQLQCATGWGSTGEWSFSMDVPVEKSQVLVQILSSIVCIGFMYYIEF